jgi:hypothetical protein
MHLANPNEKAPAQNIGMTREDLLAILAEIRKPVKSEKEIREEEQKALDRKAMGETMAQAERNRLRAQELCSHMRGNGTTTAVYVPEPINKLYCQACAKWITPENDFELFNRLSQVAG